MDIPTTDDLIESLVCPPPPPIDVSQMILSEKQLSKYIVPKVDSYLLSPTSDDKHCHHKNRSLSSKTAKYSSAKCSDQVTRPHSAAASYQRGHHHHHHHHHSHHGHHRNTIAGSGSHHHHHHHHHHHSSTKHIYHITDPQANLYGLLEQHLIPTNYDPTASTVATLKDVTPSGSGCVGEPTSATSTLQRDTSSVNQVDNSFKQMPNSEQADQQQQQQGVGHVDGAMNNEPIFEVAQQMATNDGTVEQVTTVTDNDMFLPKSGFGELTNEKLRKVIRELVDTEITYCQALDQLMTLYLDPLLKSCTLTNLEARQLVGSIPSVIITQNQFREDLTTIINNDELNIESIAKCFLNYCNDFKSYSVCVFIFLELNKKN